MRITSMELAGRIDEGQRLPRAFARIARNREDDVEVTLLLAGGEKTHIVNANDEDDVWSMARCLQETLDGFRGSRSDTMEYFRALQLFAD